MEEVQGCNKNGTKSSTSGDEVPKEVRVWCDGCYDMVSRHLRNN